MKCTACGQLHGATNRVHFAKATDAKPCPGSWGSASPVFTQPAKTLEQAQVREAFIAAMQVKAAKQR